MSRCKWVRQGSAGMAVGTAALLMLCSCGVKAVRQEGSDQAQTASRVETASLFAFVSRPGGKPVEGCDVLIEQIRRIAQTDPEGRARIVNIPPGSWVVSWRILGGLGDSTRMMFVSGRMETLNAVVRFERETENPYERRHR